MAWIRALFVSLLVLVSACTSGEAESATTEAETTTTAAASATTTTPPPTTSTLESSTTTTTADPSQVGSREVMLEEMRAAWEANRFTYDWDFEDAYIPDLQNPDPLVALEELITLTEFLERNGGSDLWWEVFTVASSPASDLWQGALLRTDGSIWIEADGQGAPFTLSEIRLASAEEAELAFKAIVGDAPDGSVVLVYAGADPDGAVEIFVPTGEQIRAIEPYNVERLVVLAPSPSGWAYFWGDWGD